MRHRDSLMHWSLIIALFLASPPNAFSDSRQACLETVNHSTQIAETLKKEGQRAEVLIRERKSNVSYPNVPGVDRLTIALTKPDLAALRTNPLSAGLADPILQEARDLHVFEDFKIVSDLSPRALSPSERTTFATRAESASRFGKSELDKRRKYLKSWIDAAYEHPKELLPTEGLVAKKWVIRTKDPAMNAAFDYTEKTWATLLKKTAPAPGGSLLGSPFPVLVPAGRFQESYYWDSYFGIQGLLATERLDIARMQAENFLEYIRRYGFIPNGGRDYYLTRSQPPFISSIVRDVYESAFLKATSEPERALLKRWLNERAYPLIKHDYENFWMNAKTRFDPKTGLNHHWDDVNIPRPERHGADNELELGFTYRDVRAAAESGLDFTDAFEGQATQVANPLLNAMLYKTENDLAWIADQLNLASDKKRFETAALNRRNAINQYLWNPARKRYESYHLSKKTNINAFSAESASLLFAGAANAAQAEAMRTALKSLERSGGLMSSNLIHSHHQWDGTNGWAPFQAMAIQGLNRYGYSADARRLAEKWVKAVTSSFRDGGSMYERVDVVTLKKPKADPGKYPTQEGFLWTNGSFAWAVHFLGHKLHPSSP